MAETVRVIGNDAVWEVVAQQLGMVLIGRDVINADTGAKVHVEMTVPFAHVIEKDGVPIVSVVSETSKAPRASK
jgi:hypothetical protein